MSAAGTAALKPTFFFAPSVAPNRHWPASATAARMKWPGLCRSKRAMGLLTTATSSPSPAGDWWPESASHVLREVIEINQLDASEQVGPLGRDDVAQNGRAELEITGLDPRG